jgi:hypothetical protein
MIMSGVWEVGKDVLVACFNLVSGTCLAGHKKNKLVTVSSSDHSNAT